MVDIKFLFFRRMLKFEYMEANKNIEFITIKGIKIPKFNTEQSQYYTAEQIKACETIEEFSDLIDYQKPALSKIEFSDEEYLAMQEALKNNK